MYDSQLVVYEYSVVSIISSLDIAPDGRRTVRCRNTHTVLKGSHRLVDALIKLTIHYVNT